jgi:hypothetical protein
MHCHVDRSPIQAELKPQSIFLVHIEVVMPRHEESVLGRQVERPSLLTGSP